MEEDIIVKKEEPVNGNKSNQTVILLAVVIIIIIGALVYFLFIKKPENDGKTSNPTPTPKATSKENEITAYKKVVLGCENYQETVNGIKIAAKYDKEIDTLGCLYELKINEIPYSSVSESISTIGIYHDYIVIYSETSGGSSIDLIDTRNTDYEIYEGVKMYKTITYTSDDLKGYFPNSFEFDNDGIIITGDAAPAGMGMVDPDPNYKHVQIRIKYADGKFGSPEVIKKYN